MPAGTVVSGGCAALAAEISCCWLASPRPCPWPASGSDPPVGQASPLGPSPRLRRRCPAPSYCKPPATATAAALPRSCLLIRRARRPGLRVYVRSAGALLLGLALVCSSESVLSGSRVGPRPPAGRAGPHCPSPELCLASSRQRSSCDYRHLAGVVRACLTGAPL